MKDSKKTYIVSILIWSVIPIVQVMYWVELLGDKGNVRYPSRVLEIIVPLTFVVVAVISASNSFSAIFKVLKNNGTLPLGAKVFMTIFVTALVLPIMLNL